MGEARRRADRKAQGKSFRPPLICLKCSSTRVEIRALPAGAMSSKPTTYGICRACGALWEAYPNDWCEDVVGASPCDNCAFSAGSSATPADDQRRLRERADLRRQRSSASFGCAIERSICAMRRCHASLSGAC